MTGQRWDEDGRFICPCGTHAPARAHEAGLLRIHGWRWVKELRREVCQDCAADQGRLLVAMVREHRREAKP